MSIKFNHTAHKEMWTWLAENPEKEKDDWPGWESNGGEYPFAAFWCFACQYALSKVKKDSEDSWLDEDDAQDRCVRCGLYWPDNISQNYFFCQGNRGLYTKWCGEKDFDTRAVLALQIANLPVKDGVETI